MAQIDNTFTAFFLNSSTAPGTPLTGLSATITIVDLSDNNVVVNDSAMTEVGSGFYKYVFASYSSTKDYAYYCDPNSSNAYMQSGVTDRRLDNLDSAISDIRVGGGFTVNYSAINNHVTNKVRELKEYIDAKMQELGAEKEIDFTPVFDKIDSIEMPEFSFEEKEAKKLAKIVNTIDKKLTEYIDSEMSDKEELGAISREFTKLEMEDRAKEAEEERKRKQKEEEERKKEEEMDKKLLEEIQAEFEKMEEEDKIEEKKELEEEIKAMEEEIQKKKKELKSL